MQVFRRPDSVYEAWRLKLRGLDPDARYSLLDLDTGAEQTFAGHELMAPGFLVTVRDQPGALVIAYHRVTGK